MIEGFRMMVIGMTVVFALLSLMVLAMQLSAAFFRRFAYLFPEPVAPSPKATAPRADEFESAVAVAIAAAYAAQKGS